MISAPAGYGKTTLLSQWAEAETRPFAWLTITEGDNDLAVLVGYLVRALDRVDPLPTETLVAVTAAGADGPDRPAAAPRAHAPRAERARSCSPSTTSTCSPTRTARARSACSSSHLPDGSQLALASRQDPPLARARLRARRTLMEIRAEDLMLTAEEGAVVLADAGVDLDPAAVDSSSSGPKVGRPGSTWPRSPCATSTTSTDAAARFSGDHRLVAEYLRDELIDGALRPSWWSS